ncbi:ArsR/SmtB family transcription factor [Paenibacillus kobensis]|uniref:ArsR/SmtB family transcription factor n=1 Tax=Paenibacillus kobensis TaxID=59841 RepID=UPI000FDAA8DF|nr:winged helix-turn-helix domain-containing protein [Paenibacillus kobensis]
MPDRDTGEHTVRFLYSECFELYNMMKLMADLPKYRRIAKQMNIDTETGILIGAEQHFSTLSSHLKREISFFFESLDSTDPQTVSLTPFNLDCGFLMSIIAHSDEESAEHWIERLDDIPAEEIIRNMVPGLFLEQWAQLLGDESWESLSADGKKLRLRISELTSLSEDLERKRQLLLECMDNPDETKDRYMLLIRSFYSKVFRQLAEQLRDEAMESAERYQLAFEQNSDFLRRVFKTDVSLLKKSTRFHVSAIQQVGSAIFEPGEEYDWAVIGSQNDRYFGPVADMEQLERLFKALADKRRLEMLRLLQERPRFGKELADELSITPGAVTYHTGFLLALDIIQIDANLSNDKRIYFSICNDQIRLLLDSAKETLTARHQERMR